MFHNAIQETLNVEHYKGSVYMGRRIAVTGGIGSGKSVVLRYIQEQGYPTVSCDEIYKEIIDESEYILQIAAIFPSVIKNGKIDRQKLSSIIFASEKKREQLNKIAHPYIMKKVHAFLDSALKNNELAFAEVPLLFENNFEKDFDAVFVIMRSLTDRIHSLVIRDGSSEEESIRKISAQFDYQNKLDLLKDMSNVYIIENDAGVEELQRKIDLKIHHMKQ